MRIKNNKKLCTILASTLMFSSMMNVYAKPIDEYKIRLFMVDTCEAYDKFVKDIIKTYSYSEAKILCDIVIDKRILIKQFFEKLEVLFENYETIDVAPYGNSLDNIGNWLTKIKNIVDSF